MWYPPTRPHLLKFHHLPIAPWFGDRALNTWVLWHISDLNYSSNEAKTSHFPRVTEVTVNLSLKSQSVDLMWGCWPQNQLTGWAERSKEFTTVISNLTSEGLWLSPDLLVAIDWFDLLDLSPTEKNSMNFHHVSEGKLINTVNSLRHSLCHTTLTPRPSLVSATPETIRSHFSWFTESKTHITLSYDCKDSFYVWCYQKIMKYASECS